MRIYWIDSYGYTGSTLLKLCTIAQAKDYFAVMFAPYGYTIRSIEREVL